MEEQTKLLKRVGTEKNYIYDFYIIIYIHILQSEFFSVRTHQYLKKDKTVALTLFIFNKICNNSETCGPAHLSLLLSKQYH